jgi:hypothetical protein
MSEEFDPANTSRQWVFYVVTIGVLSWAGLWGVIQLPITQPTRVIFFFLLFSAVTSTAMPPIAYLNARFGRCRNQRSYQMQYIRQSVWLGLFVVIAGWLQMRRLLTATLALILMAVFMLTETFLLTREGASNRA